MTILVTGAAGFIGYHVSQALLARGEEVVGVDNVNDYYDVRLKETRLARLGESAGFSFVRQDIYDHEGLSQAMAGRGIKRAVHLAAQAGVRYSLTHPFFAVQYSINRHGFRGPEIPAKGERLRLLVIGDSQAEGHGVEFGETFPALLQGEDRDWEQQKGRAVSDD